MEFVFTLEHDEEAVLGTASKDNFLAGDHRL